MKYTIVIEEVTNKAFYVEASSAEGAMRIAQQLYYAGEFILDGDSAVSYKQMRVERPEKEQTEWTEF